MKRIAIFCGSSLGTDKIYETKARALGKKLAIENIELVYGGANIGLMGAVADGALSEGGNVIGILPDFLRSKEIAHEKLTQLLVVKSMHERKNKINDLCDGFISLPGGFGTLDELFEILTLGQLALHKKPIGILNVNGFYNELIDLLDTMIEKGFLKAPNKQMVLISEDIDDLLIKMKNYQAPNIAKVGSQISSN